MKNKQKALLIASMAFLTSILLSGIVLAEPVNNHDPALEHGTVVNVVISTTYSDACDWNNVFAGSHSWSEDVYVLTWSGGWLQIHCFDGFWYGDFYSVWLVDTASGTTICQVFTTPEVETGPQHVCAINPLHTGQGTVYSDGVHAMYLAAGTYEFKVRDELLQLLVDEGVDVSATGWSPAGFYIGFHLAPEPVIPEIPFGTIMATTLMITALAGYFMLPRFKRRR